MGPGAATETIVYVCPNTAHFFLMNDPPARYRPGITDFDIKRDDRQAVVPVALAADPVVKAPAKKKRYKKRKRGRRHK